MPVSPIDRAPLDQLVESFAVERHCPTIAWGLVRDGRLALSGASGDVDDQTVYRIASMTKSFSAAATLLLRDEGAFRLDDPIGSLVPELESLRGPTIDAAPITLRDLLSMTSGLVTDDAWADRHLDLTDDDFDAIVASGPVFAQPTGTAFEYSNFGYAVLGRVVQRVTGASIQQHVSERLLGPLGMSRTTWVMPDHDEWARPLRRLGDRYTDELPPLGDGLIAPMGGLWTTVSDLAKWVAWLDDGFPARDDADDGPLGRASRREMQTSQQFIGERTYGGIRYAASYCLGLVVLHEAGRGSIVSHSGGLPGYGSNMSWRPGGRIGAIALSNSTYAPMTELGVRLLQQVDDLSGTPQQQRATPQILDQAARQLVALLNAWDDETADRLFSDNVRDDDSWTRRQAAAAKLGPLTITSIVAINGARGQIRCAAPEHPTVKITFSIAPNDPTLVQEYEIRLVEAS